MGPWWRMAWELAAQSIEGPTQQSHTIVLHPTVSRRWTSPQWAWRLEHLAKEHYSQALRSNGIGPLEFGLAQALVTFFFSPISPFWTGNAYPLPVLTPHFGST